MVLKRLQLMLVNFPLLFSLHVLGGSHCLEIIIRLERRFLNVQEIVFFDTSDKGVLLTANYRNNIVNIFVERSGSSWVMRCLVNLRCNKSSVFQ